MTLHEAIEQVLQNAEKPLQSRDIADVINNLKLYKRKDGLPVSPSQVTTRANNYTKLFTREAGKIKLFKDDIVSLKFQHYRNLLVHQSDFNRISGKADMRNLSALIIVLLFLLTYSVNAQTKDSIASALKFQIKEADSDSIRLSLKADLATRLAFFDRAIAKEAYLEVVKAINDKNYTSDYYLRLKAKVLYSLSSVSSNLGDYTEALKYANEAFDLATAIQYNRIAGKSISSMGAVYKRLNDIEKAKYYYKRALTMQKNDSIPSGYIITLNRLGAVYAEEKKYDSARYYFKKCIAIDTTKMYHIGVKANIANTYRKEKKYNIAIKTFNENLNILNNTKEYEHLSNNHLSLATAYKEQSKYTKASIYIDSAIIYAKRVNSHILLKLSYEEKAEIAYNNKNYAASRKAYLTYNKYKDSLISESRTKRLADLEYAYQYKKEKEVAAINLNNESIKKRLYFILLIIMALVAAVMFYLIRKNNKQKLELKHLEKLKADLALANRETELKKVVIENSITEEVLNKTLDDIKQIITFENEKEQQSALRSLSAALLSEKTVQKSSTNLQSYIDDVHMDFKIALDTHFPQLSTNEKELLYLMKAGLKTTEISKLQNTTLAAAKSTRYRIRKKLGLDSNQDIIDFIDRKSAL
ncbi:tetratricopeptide repeat protein [Winogradskyella psychrotolerans]|uniref:tetratricopeptide repeat protein n=1 Tax=Winogradskyella psychrotolerans TaxID=1344585 RepID=UPI001C06E01A|nr:tetratricopeptide repeat protein [Winogradskyella psychrotolerans]MBU2929104.1 tetratricopeptide repeat protein [Winogradskyella psychrotolerans]